MYRNNKLNLHNNTECRIKFGPQCRKASVFITHCNNQSQGNVIWSGWSGWEGRLAKKSGNSELQSLSDHQLNLFQVFPGSTRPQLHFHKVTWSAFSMLGFFTCLVHLLYSVAMRNIQVDPHQPMDATNYYWSSNKVVLFYFFFYLYVAFSYKEKIMLLLINPTPTDPPPPN